MHKLLIILLMLLHSILLIQSQDSAFPACSTAELEYILEWRGEFDDLFDGALNSEEDTDFLLAYGKAQIQWRGQLWTDLPHCAEAIETAALLSETTSDIAAMAALTYAGVPVTANPYVEREAAEGIAYERVENHFAGIGALVDRATRPADPMPGERQLERCDLVDMEALLEVLRASENLILDGTEVRSPDALADYANAMLDWRDGVWAQLRPCDQAISLGALITQTASDIVNTYSLLFLGIPTEQNPFGELLSEQLTELGVTMSALIVMTESDNDVQREAALPACSRDDMNAVSGLLAPISDLVRKAMSIESSDDLVEYIEKMIEWRGELWSTVPLCAESVEISLVATNTASDLASAIALAFAGKPVEDTPYWLASRDGLIAVIEWTSERHHGADDAGATAQSESLPHCTAADQNALTANVELVILFSDLIAEIDTVDELLSFGDDQISLRQQLWMQQPPCLEAVRGSQLLIQLIGDAVPAFALMMFAGVSVDHNPYMDTIGSTQNQIKAFADALERD